MNQTNNVMKTRLIYHLAVVVFLGSVLFSANDVGPQEPWEVPTKYKKMKNPTDPEVDLSIGKQLYNKHCKSCHGKTGLGDGPKAAELDTPSGDFSLASFQEQSDGELYYKSVIGRDDMPNYEKKIPDEEDRWLVINYMRTFAK